MIAPDRSGLPALLDEADSLVPESQGRFCGLRAEMDRLARLGIDWQRPAVKVDGEILRDGLEPLLAMLREGQSSPELSRAGADLADLAGSLTLRARLALQEAGAAIARHAEAATAAPEFPLPLADSTPPGMSWSFFPAAVQAAGIAEMEPHHEVLVLKVSPGAWPHAMPFPLPAGQVRHLDPGDSVVLHFGTGERYLLESGPRGARIEGPAVLSASPVSPGVLGRLRCDRMKMIHMEKERDRLREALEASRRPRRLGWTATGWGVLALGACVLAGPGLLPVAGAVLPLMAGASLLACNPRPRNPTPEIDPGLQERIDSGALAQDIRSAGLAGGIAVIHGIPVLPRRVRDLLDDIVPTRGFTPLAG